MGFCMTEKQKKEFTRRITQSNTTELIIVLYDITLVYLEDALNCFQSDRDSCEKNLRCAKNCIEEMITNLHFEVELSKEFHQIYLSMKKSLRNGFFQKDQEQIESVRNNLKTLRDAYLKIVAQDQSAPLMSHTQSVVAGLTYGRKDLNESLTGDSGKRGFLV